MPTIPVLGMHRSGTSLVASMLVSANIYMGDTLIPKDDNNPNGYWEDDEFLVINKQLMDAAKPGGAGWKAITTRKEIQKAVKQFNLSHRMKVIVASRNGKRPIHRFWGWKDPRNCITMWAWHPLLTRPRYVIVHRRIDDVIRSLIAAYGEYRWLPLIRHYRQHVETFLHVYPGVPVLHLDYDILISDGPMAEAAVVQLASFIGKPGAAPGMLAMVVKKND